jgi:hypothetical protein
MAKRNPPQTSRRGLRTSGVTSGVQRQSAEK